MSSDLNIEVLGHCSIIDDLNRVHLNKYNSIHPQNMSRIIARALSNEPNAHVGRIAIGIGGNKYVNRNGSVVVQYNSVNDGYKGDNDKSTLYNEVVSITDFSTRVIEKEFYTQVIFEGVMPELTNQADIDYFDLPSDQKLFTNLTFNEIGLYSSGKSNEKGYQDIYINFKKGEELTLQSGDELTGLTSNDITGKSVDHQFFDISVDNAEPKRIYVNYNDSITYNDLVLEMNRKLPINATAELTDRGIRIYSNTIGASSYINIKKTNDMMFNRVNGFVSIERPVYGADPSIPDNHDRLLTHLIFSPVTKTANRKFNIKYTLTIFCRRSTKDDVSITQIGTKYATI